MSDMKWKTLDSEYIFKDTWLKARKDRCMRPDGKIVEPYYVLEYPEWAAALGVTENNEVVLISQYRHAIGEVCIELPGGCVDKADATVEAAIRREFLEETGFAFNTAYNLGRTSANPSTNANTLTMFLLTGGKKVQGQMLDADEDIRVQLVSFAELQELLEQNKLLQSMHVTTIFYALQKLQKLQLNM